MKKVGGRKSKESSCTDRAKLYTVTRDVSPDEQNKRVPYLFSPVDASVKKSSQPRNFA